MPACFDNLYALPWQLPVFHLVTVITQLEIMPIKISLERRSMLKRAGNFSTFRTPIAQVSDQKCRHRPTAPPRTTLGDGMQQQPSEKSIWKMIRVCDMQRDFPNSLGIQGRKQRNFDAKRC